MPEKKLFKVNVNFHYRNGKYKEITYWFENDEQYDKWYNDQIQDERIRKIIGINDFRKQENPK